MILGHQWHRLFKVSISVASAVPSTRGRIARTSLELLSSWNGGSFRGEAQKENTPRWHRDLDQGGRAGEAAWGRQTEKCGRWGNYSITLYSMWKSLIQGVVAYLDHLPDGINAEISLQCLDKGKRWLQLLLQPQEWRQDGTTETTQWNDQALTDLLLLLGIDKVFLNSRINFCARLSVCAAESFPTASRSTWTGALKRQRTTCTWLPSEISPEFFDFCSTVPGLQLAWCLKTNERNDLSKFSGYKESSRKKQQNLIGQDYHQVLKYTSLA